jgi:hypothetical protein
MELEEKRPAADLRWVVRVEANKPGLQVAKYYLAFEPFEGKLILLGKDSP